MRAEAGPCRCLLELWRRGELWVPAAAAGRGGPGASRSALSARRPRPRCNWSPAAAGAAARRQQCEQLPQPGGSSGAPAGPDPVHRRHRSRSPPPPPYSPPGSAIRRLHPAESPEGTSPPPATMIKVSGAGFLPKSAPPSFRRCGAAEGFLLGKSAARRFVFTDFSAPIYYLCFAKGGFCPRWICCLRFRDRL